MAALVANRRRDLQVHPRPSAERPAEVSRPYLARVRQCQQPLVQRVEDAACAFLLVDGQVRARDVADEEGVACQHRPWLGTAQRVDQREGGVLGTVPGRVDGAQSHASELELPAIVEGS